jgi:hypothetical protein
VAAMVTFDNDEQGYLRWVEANPHGFVINAPKSGSGFPYMLHKATCGSITTSKQTNYTTTDFKKICSLNREELVVWGDNDSDDFRLCALCKP